MAVLRYVQSFLPAPAGLPGPAALAPGPLSRLELGPAGRLTVYDPSGSWLAVVQPGAGLLGVDSFRLADLSGTGRLLLELGGAGRMLPRGLEAGLAAEPGRGARLWLDGGTSARAGAVAVMPGGEAGWLVIGESSGSGLATFRPAAAGSAALAPAAVLADTAGRYLGGVTALAGIERDGRSWVVAASARENGISVLRLEPDGRLVQTDALGAAQQLPVSAPADLALVQTGGQVFVLLAASGSSSVSVLRLDAEGRLGFVSQVADTLHSRFAGVTAIDVLERNGQVLVAAAGTDGGVSVLQLLPDGQLIQRAVFEGHADLGMRAVGDLRLVETATGALELYLLVPEGRALLRLALDLGPPGITAGGTGTTGTPVAGTAGNDVLLAPPAGGSLLGGAGDDILVDGPGRDVLTGGAGADIFVMRRDPPAGGGADRITDFQPGIDRIDLSSWQGVYSAAALQIAATATGARIRHGERVIELVSADGKSLTPEAVRAALRFDLQPVWMAAPAVPDITGTAGNDVLTGTARAENIYGGAGDDWITPGGGGDYIDGGPGIDMVSFVDSNRPVEIRLAQGLAVSGGEQSRLTGIENVTGSIHGDYIEGDDGDNWLRGLGDWDWFVASKGADRYDGGTGRDMISYIYAPGPVTVDLADPSRNRGLAAGDSYISIERVTGSSFNDSFRGTDAEEDFRGMGGDDWFVGSEGRDRYDGGPGRDTVAYSSAPGGVVASLLLGRGTSGQAARDLYTSIENLTGSAHDDVLTGDHSRNVLRGLNGNDVLIGNGGNDWLYGGGGDDVIDGGPGWDVAFYEGRRAQYAISTERGVTTVRWTGPGAGEGTDTLTGVEVLRFADGDFYL